MTSYHDGNENNHHHFVSPVSALSPGHNEYSNRDAHAPELAPGSSPTAVSNLEAEYKRQYLEMRDAEHPPIPNDDTAKEVLSYDESAKMVVPSELDIHGQYPQTATGTNPPVPWDTTTVGDRPGQRSVAGGPPAPAPAPAQKKILGMNLKGFFILLAVLIIIIAAAVGGGFGGAVASTKSKSDSTAPATTSAPSSSRQELREVADHYLQI